MAAEHPRKIRRVLIAEREADLRNTAVGIRQGTLRFEDDALFGQPRRRAARGVHAGAAQAERRNTQRGGVGLDRPVLLEMRIE